MLVKVIDPAPIIKELADRCLVAKGVECSTLGKVIDMIHTAVAKDGVDIVPCKCCEHSSHVDSPEGRVWCTRMCRYMLLDGYCSYGERKDNGNL